jgi:hypothetical protein
MKEWSFDTESFLAHFSGKQIFVVMDDVSNRPRHQQRDYRFAKQNLIPRNNKHKESIFFTVNELDQSKDPERERTTAMFVRARALFGDDDVKRLEPRKDFDLKPSLIVQSSSSKEGNKYHYYWLIEDDNIINLEQWNILQSKLVAHYEFDKGAKDCTRYLRLPGYLHWKDRENPSRVCFIDNNVRYSFDELHSVFGKYSEIPETAIGSESLSNSSKSKFVPEIDDPVFDALNNRGLIIERISSGIYRLDCPWTDNHTDKTPDGSARYFLAHYNGYDQGNFKCHHSHCHNKTVFSLKEYLGIADGYENWESIELNDVFKDEVINLEFPMPPGDLGEFIQELYEMQRYQYKEVAFVTGMGLLAGICGRKFNVEDLGLNLYMTILMDTGMGKDFIGKTIKRILATYDKLGGGVSFIGAQRFTASKGLVADLQNSRSQICVFTEAGLLMQSGAGDQENLRKAILSLYTLSDYNGQTGRELYSKNVDDIKSIKSPALSIINESTPSTILAGYHKQNDVENGLLPRQNLYRVDCDKPYHNKNIRPDLSDKLRDKVKFLINLCKSCQSTDEYTPIILEWYDLESDVDDFESTATDLHNKNKGDFKGGMCSRMPVKAKKYAALASIFNNRKEYGSIQDVPNSMFIGEREWAWAKNMVLYEFNQLFKFFAGSNFINIKEDLSKTVVAPALIKILQGRFASYKPNKDDKDSKIVRMSLLSQVLKHNKSLKYSDSISDPVNGLEEVLSYMRTLGYIEIIDAKHKTGGNRSKYERRFAAQDGVKVLRSLTELVG